MAVILIAGNPSNRTTPVPGFTGPSFGDQLEGIRAGTVAGRFQTIPFVPRAVNEFTQLASPGLKTNGTLAGVTAHPVFRPNFPVILTVSPVQDTPAFALWTDQRQTGFPGPSMPRERNMISSVGHHNGQSYITAGVIRAAVNPWPDPGEQFWFDRLHVLPTTAETTDLGNVVNDVDTTFEIFNASRTLAATINVLTQDNAGGFTFLVGAVPPSPVLIIPAQGSEGYILRAEAEVGPPTIAATFTWVPSAPFNAVDVTFTGNRITILAFEPQVGPLTEYTFITSIVESYNGTEQRMAMRDRPRQSITYTFRKGDGNADIEEPYYAEAQAFEHVMFDSIGRVFALPVWEDRTILTAAVAATDTVINLVTAGLDIQEGELLLLWRDWNDNEAQAISSFTASTVTVASPFVGAFTIENTVVLPTWTAFIDDNVSQTIGKLDTALWRTRFVRRIERVVPNAVSPILPDDFDGLPIWPRRWGITGNTIGRAWNRNIQEVGNELGFISRSFRKTVPKRAHSQLYVELRGRADFEQFRSFILALKGKQKIFWLGMQFNQFNLQATTVAGGGSIRVFNNFYSNFVAERAYFNLINIVTTGEVSNFHTIVASSDVGVPPNNETDLTITPVAPIEYNVNNVIRIEYFTRHRLDTDIIRFQAIRPKDSYTQTFPIVEVINET